MRVASRVASFRTTSRVPRVLAAQFSAAQQQHPPSAPQTHAQIKGRKRFFKDVAVREASEPADSNDATLILGGSGGGRLFEIALDGRALRTPGRAPLLFGSEPLALAVAAEWDAQVGDGGIEPGAMPLMSLASTAVDQVAIEPTEVAEKCFAFLATDTACFYVDPSERIMRKRQRACPPQPSSSSSRT